MFLEVVVPGQAPHVLGARLAVVGVPALARPAAAQAAGLQLPPGARAGQWEVSILSTNHGSPGPALPLPLQRAEGLGPRPVHRVRAAQPGHTPQH